jgi:putative selenium metabolism protein SsnA
MLITHGTVVTLGARGEIIADGAVLIHDDKVSAVGPTSELAARYPQEASLDARGKLVMPGSICAHTHFYGAFARGMPLPPGPPPKNFPEILKQLWWKIDRALTLEDSKYSALVCLVDAIRHGTTTLIDHHASPNAIDGSLDVIAEAVEEAGVRACLCYEVTDRNGAAGATAGVRENVRFLKRLGTRKEKGAGAGETAAHSTPLVTGTFGLHASFTVSDRTLERCLAERGGMDSGFHIHVAEDSADQDDAVLKYGTRVGDRLLTRGILGAKTIAAHCVHIDPGEIELLRRTGTQVSHQPRSNMNNAVGVADIPGMLREGITVGLGNDGFSNNMFAEMKTAFLLHKLHRRDPRVMGADQVLQIAYANNAKLASNFWDARLGELTPGACADIVLLDYVPYSELTPGNFPWHLIFGVDGSNVTHTICGGRILMKDRELVTLDETAIAARALELSRGVWQRVQTLDA